MRCGERAVDGRAQCAPCLARVKTWNQRARPVRAGLAAPTVRPWTGAQVAKLRELYAAGVSRPEMAKALGRTVCAIDAQVDARQLHRKPIARFWTPARVAELRRLHAAGMLLREIGALLGVSRQSITNRAKRLGLKRGLGGDHRSKLAMVQQRPRCVCGLTIDESHRVCDLRAGQFGSRRLAA